MIKISVKKTNGLIKSITIEGHAGQNESSKDIVCAGVSAISQGACNAIEELTLLPTSKFVKVSDGYLHMELRDDEKTQLIASVMLIQLKSVEEANKGYVNIIEM